MKKLLIAFSLLLPTMMWAQLVNVKQVSRIDLPQSAKVTGVSPTGEYVLLTSDTNEGLDLFDLRTGATTTLSSKSGAGYNPLISTDGTAVAYRETSINRKHLKMTSLFGRNMQSGKTTRIVKNSRTLTGYSFEGNTVAAVSKGKTVRKAIGKSAATERPTLSIDNTQLMITSGGTTTRLSPNGTQVRYLWPSLSPDGKKVLYYVSGKGAYVAGVDGTNPQFVAMLRAPKWMGNDMIVGMNDRDNGEVVTESTVVVADVQGRTQVVSPAAVIAMYPYATAAADMIVFSTPDGQAYKIEISK